MEDLNIFFLIISRIEKKISKDIKDGNVKDIKGMNVLINKVDLIDL